MANCFFKDRVVWFSAVQVSFNRNIPSQNISNMYTTIKFSIHSGDLQIRCQSRIGKIRTTNSCATLFSENKHTQNNPEILSLACRS